MERRKDSQGKVLKEGESQRKDGRYQYRWIDEAGKRHTVYSTSLKDLRIKERDVQESILSGVNYKAGNITVYDLSKRCADLRKYSLSPNSVDKIESHLKRLNQDPMGKQLISNVMMSDAKLWVKDLYESGLSFGSINDYRATISSAFQSAYEDGIIAKNPFTFKLSKVIPNQKKEKIIITSDQYKKLLEFMRGNGFYRKRMDEVIILYETGIRASELCGLTKSDIDFDIGLLKIDHQIYRHKGNSTAKILKPKSTAGVRVIPLSEQAMGAFKRVVAAANERKTDL